MVRKELEGYSDFDLNALAVTYPTRLGHLQMDESTLYNSSKFRCLKGLLPDLISQGHRVLMFSQWTTIMNLMEALLEALDIAYLRLDGSTPISERQALIDRYALTTGMLLKRGRHC